MWACIFKHVYTAHAYMRVYMTSNNHAYTPSCTGCQSFASFERCTPVPSAISFLRNSTFPKAAALCASPLPCVLTGFFFATTSSALGGFGCGFPRTYGLKGCFDTQIKLAVRINDIESARMGWEAVFMRVFKTSYDEQLVIFTLTESMGWKAVFDTQIKMQSVEKWFREYVCVYVCM